MKIRYFGQLFLQDTSTGGLEGASSITLRLDAFLDACGTDRLDLVAVLRRLHLS